MIRNNYFFLIISLTIGFTTSAQSVTEVVEFANRQFEAGNYTIASKEYNRAFFFGYEYKDILSLQIAKCYTQLGENELSKKFYDKAYLLSHTDSLKNEAILGKSFSLLIDEQFVLVISELFNLSDNATTNQQIRYHFIKGIAHFGINDDSTSLKEFQKIIPLSGLNDSCATALQNEYNKLFRYQKKYNPTRAYIMSAIIPGSGQFSVGAVKEGINSMILIGALYLISFKVVALYSVLDAMIALFPWIQRYYIGGMDNAKAIANAKIKAKRYESYNNIIELTIPKNYQ